MTGVAGIVIVSVEAVVFRQQSLGHWPRLLLVRFNRVRYTSDTMRGHPCTSKSQRIEKGSLWEDPFMLPSTVQAPADSPCDESCDDLSRNGCHPRGHNGPPYYPPNLWDKRDRRGSTPILQHVPIRSQGPAGPALSNFHRDKALRGLFHARKEGTP